MSSLNNKNTMALSLKSKVKSKEQLKEKEESLNHIQNQKINKN